MYSTHKHINDQFLEKRFSRLSDPLAINKAGSCSLISYSAFDRHRRRYRILFIRQKKRRLQTRLYLISFIDNSLKEEIARKLGNYFSFHLFGIHSVPCYSSSPLACVYLCACVYVYLCLYLHIVQITIFFFVEHHLLNTTTI